MHINKLLPNLAIAAVISLPTISAAEHHAASESPITLAKEYLAAYSTFDVTKIDPYISDDMVFHDPTTTPPGADDSSLLMTGKTAAL